MNTITNSILKSGAITVAFFALAMFAVVPVAHATDIIGGSYADGGYYDAGFGGSYADGGYYDSGFGGSYADMGYYDSWSPSSFGGCGGTCGGFGGSSFGGGGFRTTPSSSWTSTSNLVTNNGNTSIYAPQNTNVCTGGNVCNDNSIYDGRITITGNNTSQTPTAYPVYQPVVYSQPYPVYTPPAPYYPQQPRAPYVSLSAAPYTGLELGPIGTALYWSFLVLWCLAAAYLIAVKKVQNKIVAGLNSFLFGTPAHAGHAHTAHVAHSTHSTAKVHAAPARADEGIDSFIASQINRAR